MAPVTEHHKINDEITIFKQDNSKNYYARVKIGRKWHTKTTGTKDQMEATVKAVQIQTTFQYKPPPSKKHQFVNIANKAIKRMKEENDRAIYKDYIQVINKYLIPYFGKTPISDIDRQALFDFDKWRTEQAGRVLAKSTILNHNAALMRVFDEAEIGKIITHTQVPKLKNTGVEGKKRVAFTKEEVGEIISNEKWFAAGRKQVTRDIRKLLRNYILVAVGTGMRPGTEMENLQWCDVGEDTEDGETVTTITVRKGKTTKHTDTRTIVCRDNLTFVLKDMRFVGNHTLDDDLVFAMPNGKPPKDLSRSFKALLKDCDLLKSKFGDRTLYSLRHSYITWALRDKTLTTAAIASQCGTSETMIEEHYNHLVSLMFRQGFSKTI